MEAQKARKISEKLQHHLEQVMIMAVGLEKRYFSTPLDLPIPALPVTRPISFVLRMVSNALGRSLETEVSTRITLRDLRWSAALRTSEASASNLTTSPS